MEKLSFGLGVSVLGMVVVFVGLLIIIAFILILSWANSLEKKKKTDANQEAKSVEASAPAIEETVEEGIPNEVVAAITAAIACVWDKDTGFVVRRVRRIHQSPVWAQTGKEEQISNHF